MVAAKKGIKHYLQGMLTQKWHKTQYYTPKCHLNDQCKQVHCTYIQTTTWMYLPVYRKPWMKPPADFLKSNEWDAVPAMYTKQENYVMYVHKIEATYALSQITTHAYLTQPVQIRGRNLWTFYSI